MKTRSRAPEPCGLMCRTPRWDRKCCWRPPCTTVRIFWAWWQPISTCAPSCNTRKARKTWSSSRRRRCSGPANTILPPPPWPASTGMKWSPKALPAPAPTPRASSITWSATWGTCLWCLPCPSQAIFPRVPVMWGRAWPSSPRSGRNCRLRPCRHVKIKRT